MRAAAFACAEGGECARGGGGSYRCERDGAVVDRQHGWVHGDAARGDGESGGFCGAGVPECEALCGRLTLPMYEVNYNN